MVLFKFSLKVRRDYSQNLIYKNKLNRGFYGEK